MKNNQFSALYSNHDLEKERLEEFCASDGTDDRWDYANRPRRSLAESLADFPNTVTNFPIEAIFELFPLIRSRPYSICSYSPHHIEILCAVVKYRSRNGSVTVSSRDPRTRTSPRTKLSGPVDDPW